MQGVWAKKKSPRKEHTAPCGGLLVVYTIGEYQKSIDNMAAARYNEARQSISSVARVSGR